MTDDTKFPCPCCGYRVHDREPGFHQVCPICGWEDDLTQLRFARMPGSSNTVSLEEAQRNFRDYGASERRSIGNTRTPVDGETLDKGWRLIDPSRDNIEQPMRGTPYAEPILGRTPPCSITGARAIGVGWWGKSDYENRRGLSCPKTGSRAWLSGFDRLIL